MWGLLGGVVVGLDLEAHVFDLDEEDVAWDVGGGLRVVAAAEHRRAWKFKRSSSPAAAPAGGGFADFGNFGSAPPQTVASSAESPQ